MKVSSWIWSTFHCVVVSLVLYAVTATIACLLQGTFVGKIEALKQTSRGGCVWVCTFEDEPANTHKIIRETTEALSANDRVRSEKMFFVPLARAADIAHKLAVEFGFTNAYPSPLCVRAAVLLAVLRDMGEHDALVLIRSRVWIKKDLNLLVTEPLTSSGSLALFKDPKTGQFQTDFMVATKNDFTTRVAKEFFTALVHANMVGAASVQADRVFNSIVNDMATFSHLNVKRAVSAASGSEFASLDVSASIEDNQEVHERTRTGILPLPQTSSHFLSDARDRGGLAYMWLGFKEWAQARLFGSVVAI